MNNGKRFEEDFKKSIPRDVFYLRLRDAGGWSNADNTRFTISNICDHIVHYKGKLFLMELKTHKGKSLPYNCIDEDILHPKKNKNSKKNKDNKVLILIKHSQYKDVFAYYLVYFSDISETYALSAWHVLEHINAGNRKSIELEYFKEHGILIPQWIARTRQRYDVLKLLET